MPLISGKKARTRKGFKHNLKAELKAGKPKKQALAISYAQARESEDDDSILDLTMDSARTNDINGWAEIKGNPISKVGVFPYSGAQISPELDPDRIYYVYRPEEELADLETIESFKLIPWTDEHAMLGSEDDGLTAAERKGVQGVIGEDVYFEDGYLKANLKIFSNKLKSLIDSGKKELSIGYRCLYDLETGVYNGVRYDAIQRQIRGNHVALVEEGRSGHDVAVLDHFKFTFDTKGLKMADMENKPDEVKDEGEEMTLQELIQVVKGLHEKIESLSGKGADEDEEEKEELSKKAAEEGDEAGEPWNEEEDEADPAMFVTKAKLNEDESEEEKEKEAEDEEEKEGDMEKPADAKDTMDSMKRTIFKEMAVRDELVKRLQPHIGVFDHKEKTLDEVAAYAIRRLKVPCTKGHEHAAIEGFLRGARISAPAVAQDSRYLKSDCIDAYLSGGK